jgi:photosystem II stability/assembly factor-like uncharacterized protein
MKENRCIFFHSIHFIFLREFAMRNIFLPSIILITFTFTLFFSIKTIEHSSCKNYEKCEEQGASGALEALDFWTRSRAYPDKDIPTSKYFHAFQTAKIKVREISGTLSSGSIWDPIGPLNLQGRSKSVALNPLNPNTVYVGTASGGLWRSHTAGLSGDWEQVKLGFPALGISAISIDPSDTNTMYLGTGEVYRYATALGGLAVRTTRGSYGIGILKTTDGGKTWMKSLDWSYKDESGIQSIKMNPLNPHTLWAATTEGIYKTTDAGATWEQSLWVYMAEDIAVHSTDTNRALCTIGNFTTSMTKLTTDGGISWNTSPLPSYTGKTMLAVYAAHPNVVYASAADDTTGIAALYRSTDFGESWIKLRQYSNTNGLYGVQGWYSHYVAVHPQDSSIIILNAVGRSKSINGGKTFYNISSGYSDNHSYAIHPTDPNIIYVVNDDGIYRSTDFGDSYDNIGFGLQSGQIYNGFSCSITDSLIALAQSQDHIPGYRYLGSSIWDHGTAADEAGWTAIDPLNDNIMYAVNRFGGTIFKSSDRGNTFMGTSSFDGDGAWNSPIVICPANTNILYLGNKRIFKSTDASTSWAVTNGGGYLDGNPALSMSISATNPDTIYVGTAPLVTNAHLYRTTNGGASWTNVTGILPNRYPIDLAVDPTNSKIVYAAYGGFGGGHLFKSTDAGATWTDASGTLPDAPTTAIVVDPMHPNIIYVGNDIGIYVSTDAGGNWSSFNSGLPDAVIVADLAISQSNRTLRVATHGNGIWERKLLYELPINYFDYKALTVNSPVDGSQYELGTTISQMRASFRNLSAFTPVDSFDVKLRILLENIEVYSATKRIAGLALAETRIITFDGNFTPTNDGTYFVQAITTPTDNNSSNDTARSIFNVISAPTISRWTVTKIYSSYTEIVGGSAGPYGDDSQIKAPIPFKFVYDNHQYDSVQISTNGWIELGSGTPGYLFGLSTNSQLGAYFVPSLATKEHPTKALGPWWCDLSAEAGHISYATTGSIPNRTFIIQWKNVPAYCCDPTTTTFLNFQVKLFETSNVLEFSYGPLIAGALPTWVGASIGLKDYAGGDYRYYDIARHATGLASELRNDLNPLSDWPGEDSCYHIITNGSVGVKEVVSSQLPSYYSLSQNYPNPFNPLTTISFDIPTRSLVNLRMYDILGKEVMTLAEGEREAGSYTIHIDFSHLASGVYLYRLEAGSFTDVKKMVVTK